MPYTCPGRGGKQVRLEELLDRLDKIPLGHAGEKQYEEFVGEVIRLCFFSWITNVQPKTRDVAGTTIKDWVGSNVATGGFFGMLKNHPQYRATQVIWECKNYDPISASDFHQATYYMGGAMGNVCFLCFRGDPKDRLYYEHVRHVHATKNAALILLISDADLKVFLRQAKNGKTKDSHLQNRFDETTRLIG